MKSKLKKTTKAKEIKAVANKKTLTVFSKNVWQISAESVQSERRYCPTLLSLICWLREVAYTHSLINKNHKNSNFK